MREGIFLLELTDIAAEVHGALSNAQAIKPFSARGVRPSEAEAYGVTAALRSLRGARVVGRKIGFTNRNIWPLYNIAQPIWGDVTEDSLLDGGPIPLSRYVEPRLEPEIVLGLSQPPAPDMDEAALAACIDWVAPGFEVVQSIYPGWKFETADTIMAGGLHGGLLIGQRFAATPEVLAGLTDVSVALSRNGEEVEHGVGANALDGPVPALRHLVQVLAKDAHNPALAAGEVVTTGTLTDAWALQAGEMWSANYGGVMEAEISLQCE